MIRLNLVACSRAALPIFVIAASAATPYPALAQASPFLTGATALQTNILAWLTPIAVILIMVLGGMAMANRIVENCGNTLILRCAGSEGGGTSQFASRLIGEREIVRRQVTRGRDREGFGGGRGSRRSTQVSEQHVTEAALMPSELEQLPDLTGYLKTASAPAWKMVSVAR
jgi:Type IV secretion-system coupling protein DNA-binding domain